MEDLLKEVGAHGATLAILIAGFWYVMKIKQNRSECSVIEKVVDKALKRGEEKFDTLQESLGGEDGIRVQIARLQTTLDNYIKKNGR